MRQTCYEDAHPIKASELVELVKITNFHDEYLPRGTLGCGEEGLIDGPGLELVGTPALSISTPIARALLVHPYLPLPSGPKTKAALQHMKLSRTSSRSLLHSATLAAEAEIRMKPQYP